MLILSERNLNPGSRALRVGHRPWPSILMIPFLLLPPGLAIWAAPSAVRALSPWILVPLGIVALPLVLLLVLAAGAALQTFLAGFSSRNWLLQADEQGLWIKFRSYLNRHFDESDPAVMFLGWGEIAQVRRLTRRRHLKGGSERGNDLVDTRSVIELTLADGVGTQALENALRAERARPAPQGSFLGIKSRTRFKHDPVRVAAPGIIEIEWLGKRAMRLFDGRTTVVSAHREGFGADRREISDDDILVAAERGEVFDAVRFARKRYGMSLAEAKRFVEELRGEAVPRAGAGKADADIEVLGLARSGERLKAVRLAHDRYGLGLMEARILVDKLSGRN